MENNEKTMRALGLCAKARRLICGTPQVCEALRGKNRPYLVLEAMGNSANTSKRIADKCTYYGVELIRLSIDGDALSHAIGKSGRVAAVAITDESLSRLLRSTCNQEHS